MKLEGKPIDMETDNPVVLVNEKDAEELGIYAMDRVNLSHPEGETVAVVDTTENLVKAGIIGLTRPLHGMEGELDVSIAPKPDSVHYIKEKMKGGEWSKEEVTQIIEDINKNALSDIELGAYVSSIYMEELSLQETVDLTEAMVDAGDSIEWDEKVLADKHSIGGVPGNRVTPIIIPIIASTSLTIPKTSSRAITSPAGTADTMESISDVEFSIDEIKALVEEENGCLAWGGSVNLSPVDDKIIRAEHPLSLDPEGQVIASVLSKKKSAGSTHVVIDIPYGEGAKVTDIEEARRLAKQFKKVGEAIGMNIECTITNGSQPIGKGIGPALEARDCLKVLKGEGPKDLEVKAVRLANVLMDMCGKNKKAMNILHSGKALEKFRSIIEAQNGDPGIEPKDIDLGEHTYDVYAESSGRITHLDNERITTIARRAGAPKDLGAGVYLHSKKNDRVEKGDKIMTVYAEKKNKLAEAEKACNENNGFRIEEREEMLLEEV